MACDRIIIPPADLVFPAQQGDESDASVRIYNPALVRFQGRLLMAWRWDSGRRQTMCRQIRVCTLDDHLGVTSGPIVNLSESIQDGGAHHWARPSRIR